MPASSPTTKGAGRRNGIRGPANTEALLAAAHRLALERGEDFTTQDLIKEADVALQTFYRHFGGKDQILIAVLGDLIAAHCESLETKAAELEDPVERLRYYIMDTLAVLVGDPGATGARFMTSQHWRLHQLFPDELAVATRPFADLVQRELEAARAAGLLGPRVARADAWMINRLVMSVFHHYAYAATTTMRPPSPRTRGSSASPRSLGQAGPAGARSRGRWRSTPAAPLRGRPPIPGTAGGSRRARPGPRSGPGPSPDRSGCRHRSVRWAGSGECRTHRRRRTARGRGWRPQSAAAWRCPREPSGRGTRRRRHVAGDQRRRFVAQQLLDRNGDSARLSTSCRRWSGCSANTLPAQPMNRVVVSFPAPATTESRSAAPRVSVRVVPVVVLELRVEESVMMSSDGWSARQSRYSANRRGEAVRPSSGSPASVRSRASSVADRDLVGLGDPRSMPMTCIGISAPRSSTKSKPPDPTRGSKASRGTPGSVSSS